MLKKVFALFGVTALVFMAGCTSNSSQTSSSGSNSDPFNTGGQAANYAIKQLEMPKADDDIAIISTTMGDIKVKFFPEYAPKAVENFQTHSKNGYYNNLIFHRVINNFMIQTGDPRGDGTGGESIWGGTFKDEFTPKLWYYTGALAMANSGPDTNGSQFFIVQNKQVTEDQVVNFPNDLKAQYIKNGGYPLDKSYTIFGQVYEGMDVVDKIASAKTIGGTDDKTKDKPVNDIKMISITVEKYK